MMEWLQEINWIMVFMVGIPIVIQSDFQRRRAEARGEIYSFVTLRASRILNVAMAFSGAMLAASATVALKQPTVFHVWMLLAAVAASFVSFLALHNLETNGAKRAVADARDMPGRNESATRLHST